VTEPLTPQQRRVAEHRGGPLAVTGAAGTGKTTALVARFAHLVADGTPPESILVVVATHAAAARMRTALDGALGDRAFEELVVGTVPELCARIVRAEASAADPGAPTTLATPADRLAMMLERVDELDLRRHDFRGNAAAMLSAVIARIDRSKEELVDAGAYAAWAASLDDDDERAPREREFAGLFAAHDEMLAQRGAMDPGGAVLLARALLCDHPAALARTAERWQHVLVDAAQDLPPAHAAVVALLGAAHGSLVVAGDPAQAVRGGIGGRPGTWVGDLVGTAAEHVVLEHALRTPAAILAAAEAVVAPIAARGHAVEHGHPGTDDPTTPGTVAFWRTENERAQAQAVAADIEHRVREGTDPGQIAVLLRSVRHEGQALAVALEERAVPHHLVGDAAFFQHAEVRDVLAWLRLLVDPGDAGAAVRVLARPPVELRSVDLARCVQIARRRKLDMVSALVAATESPQLAPEAREHVLGFLRLHRSAAQALDTSRPDLFVHRLIDRLGLRRQQLFSAQADVVQRLRNLALLGEMAADHVRRSPQATAREFARYLTAVADLPPSALREGDGADVDAAGTSDAVQVMTMHAAKGLEFDHVYVLGLHLSRMPGARDEVVEPVRDQRLPRENHVADMRRMLYVAMTRARERLVLAYATGAMGAPTTRRAPSPFAEEARAAVGGEWEEREEELFGPDEALHAVYQGLRDELLRSVPKVGNRIGELRLDTDLDVAHGTVRYLELVKLAALLERPVGQSVADALPDINTRLLQAATAQQREILETSSLDGLILRAERDTRARAAALAARDEPSLKPFLPTRGEGLTLSASDIETYRTCPLKYKFARVFRIPSEPTLNQRFGILVHQVLERYHAGTEQSVEEMLGLLDVGWRRGGFGDSAEERQLHGKASTALQRYHGRFLDEDTEPVWFEKSFQFTLGPHVLRGRVDRVDRLPGGGYELIDYKTGRPRSASQLREDVQLSLYAVAARSAWDVDAACQSYHYVLDDEKVPVPTAEIDRDWISDTVMEVGEGILGQGFEPTPSYAACSMCDFRIACPAAER
jgi:DNA helicase-2/ATP-dependent DNA helicase PcrA